MYFEQATLFDVDYGKQLGIGTDSTAIFKGCARRDMPLDLKPEHGNVVFLCSIQIRFRFP